MPLLSLRPFLFSASEAMLLSFCPLRALEERERLLGLDDDADFRSLLLDRRRFRISTSELFREGCCAFPETIRSSSVDNKGTDCILRIRVRRFVGFPAATGERNSRKSSSFGWGAVEVDELRFFLSCDRLNCSPEVLWDPPSLRLELGDRPSKYDCNSARVGESSGKVAG